MLDAAVDQAIAGGRVPTALRRPLRDAVDAIVASLPAPAPNADGESDHQGKGKGKGKGKQGDGGDD
jgi:hypothetical protein